MISALLVRVVYRLSRNAIVYELTEPGFAFKPLGGFHLTRRRLLIDLTRLKHYPDNDWVVELQPRTARRLQGREITVRTLLGDRVHQVTGLDPFGGYWFTVPLEEDDESFQAKRDFANQELELHFRLLIFLLYIEI